MNASFRSVVVLLVIHLISAVTFAALPPTLIDGSLDVSKISPTVSPAVTGQTLTFADGTFNPSDWSPGPVVNTSNAPLGTQVAQQMPTGGNPGAFWQFTTSNVGEPGTANYHPTYFNNSAFFNPSIGGPITSMSGGFNQNLLAFSGIMDVFDASLVLRQNGSVYLPLNFFGLSNTPPGWFGNTTMFGPSGAIPIQSSSDWHLVAGSGPLHPNFTTTGSAIQFGLLAGAYFNDDSGTNVGGMDNWTFNVTFTPIPEPMMLALLPLLFLTRRRGSRVQ